MLWLLALSLLSAATIGSVLAYQRGANQRLGQGHDRRRQLPAPTQASARERTIQTLRPGDVVIFGEEDWLITGTATYQEEQETWWVHVLEDGTQQQLMEVRERERWTVTLLDPADDVPTFGALGMGLTFRSKPFRLARRGDAMVSVEGDGQIPPGLIRYATYSGPGSTYLNVEEREGTRAAFAATEVDANGLMLMPGEPLADDPLADLS